MPSSSPSPSATLHQIEITLQGLSFAEHDDGRQRTALSETLSQIVTYAASGLLLADHGRSHLHSTLQNLTTLLTTQHLTALLTWTLIPSTDADALAIQYFTRASTLLLSLDTSANFPDHAPLQAAQHLEASTKLLQFAADAPRRRSAAVNQAPAPFLHVYLFLRHTTHANILHDPFETFCHMRRVEKLRDCIVPVFPALQPLLLRACTIESDVYRHAHISTPASVIADVCACFAEHEKLPNHLTLLFDLLLPLIEDVDAETRVLAAGALHTIMAHLLDRDLRQSVGRLAPVLRGSLVWRDAPTAQVIAPMLARVLRLIRRDDGLRESVDVDWERGVGELVALVEALSTARGHVRNELEACVTVAAVVADVLGERLLRRAVEWVSLVSDLMVRVAAEVRNGDMHVEVFECAALVVVEAIGWTWLLEQEYRVKLFEACVGVVYEVQNCKAEVRKRVWDGVENILVCLARCEGRDGVLKLVWKVRKQTRKYPSLERGDELFAAVQDRVKAEMEADREAHTVAAGQFVGKIFPEVL